MNSEHEIGTHYDQGKSSASPAKFLIPALLLLLGLFWYLDTPRADQQDASSLVVKGNSSYQEGDFDSAVDFYLSAIQNGADNGYVYYNLGNAYYRGKHLGKAIASYRKALLELPRNADLNHNLTMAREKVVDDIPDISSSLLDKLLVIHSVLSSYELRLAIILTFAFACVALAIGYGLQIKILKTPGFICVGFALVLLLLDICSTITPNGKLRFAPFSPKRVTAVVTAEEVDVHSRAASESQVVFVLHEGAEIYLQDESWFETESPWLAIRIPGASSSDGSTTPERSGYVQTKDLEVISQP